MRALFGLIVLAAIVYVGVAIYPGVDWLQEEVGHAEIMGVGASACKYNTLKETRTMVLTKAPGSEDSIKCPKFVLLTDERLSD